MRKMLAVKSEKGFSLLDVLVSLGLISLLCVGLFSAMAGAVHTTATTDQIDTARLIAQAQMENIKQQTFRVAGDYSINQQILDGYPGQGYSILNPVVVNAQDRDGLIQKITVIVVRNGKTVMTLQDCKTK
jgi:type II secretory pathway pseudopilin PulG